MVRERKQTTHMSPSLVDYQQVGMLECNGATVWCSMSQFGAFCYIIVLLSGAFHCCVVQLVCWDNQQVRNVGSQWCVVGSGGSRNCYFVYSPASWSLVGIILTNITLILRFYSLHVRMYEFV